MKMTTLLEITAGLAISAFVLWFVFWSGTAQGQEVKFTLPTDPPLSLARLTTAIKAVEHTPRWAVGPAGERSEYQITEDTWRMWSLKPFTVASQSSAEATTEILLVVQKHLAYIKGVLQKSGYTHTPYSVGCIWKAGATRWAEHRLRFQDTQYAERVANVYCDTQP